MRYQRDEQPCRWIEDKDVPGGRYLVPGCINRAVYGDDADCHCETHTRTDDPEGTQRCPCCGQIVPEVSP